MWPWGHLAVGYLAYSLVAHLRDRRPPSPPAAVAVALASQLPDLVDKPLAWTFDVIPSGRSLAHSLPIALIVVTVVGIALHRRGHADAGVAFGVGYLTHLFGDALNPALGGDLSGLAFLAWPLVPAVEEEPGAGFAFYLAEFALDPAVTVQFVLGLAVVVLWLADGAPGLGAVAAIPRWVGRKLSA